LCKTLRAQKEHYDFVQDLKECNDFIHKKKGTNNRPNKHMASKPTLDRKIDFVPNSDVDEEENNVPRDSAPQNQSEFRRNVWNVLRSSLIFLRIPTTDSSSDAREIPDPPLFVLEPDHPEVAPNAPRVHKECPFSPTHPEVMGFTILRERALSVDVDSEHFEERYDAEPE